MTRRDRLGNFRSGHVSRRRRRDSSRRSALAGIALLLAGARGAAARPAQEARSVDEPAATLRWFVAPEGDDAADGRSLHAEGGHAPFRTLRRAFEAVRAAKVATGGSLPGTATIELAPALHFLDEPLRLGPDDGDGGERGRVVVRTAGIDAPNAAAFTPHAVISGGQRIGGWRRTKLGERDGFVAKVAPLAAHGSPFRELWIDGKRRPRARHPDRGYLTIAAIDAADAAKPWNAPIAAFSAAPLDVAPLVAAAREPRPDGTLADVVAMGRWIENHCRVEALDAASGRLALRDPTVFKLEPDDLWYAEGARAFLDAPGEWWLDEAAGELYVLPLPGEELDRCEVIAPRLTHLLEITGDAASGRVVAEVSFEELDFAHSEWWFAPPTSPGGPRASGFPQAAVGVPAAIRLEGTSYVSFHRCTIAHVGSYALSIERASSNVLVDDCDLTDLGGGGVKLGTTALDPDAAGRGASFASIERCAIVDGGRLFHASVGIWGGQHATASIQGNEIANFYYSGISLGWTWGYGPAAAAGSQVRLNAIHHIGQRSDGDGPILADMGGIYTLGNHDGTVIERNWFHDIAARRYGGWGIYFDEGTTKIVARDNVVERTTHGGFHQHYGRDNLVERNLFVDGRDAQVQRTRFEEHTSFTFRRNVVLFGQGELFAGDLAHGNVVFEENLYWRRDGGPIRFAGGSFAEWQARELDGASRLADPGFVEQPWSRFTLAADAPAAALLDREHFAADRPARYVPWATPWQERHAARRQR